MKTPGILAKWLFVFCVPVLLLSSSLAWAANSLWLYQYGADKYHVRETLADSGLKLTDSELEQIYSRLISYFNSGEEYISLTQTRGNQQIEVFTPEEVIHFKDVKGLIWLDYRLLLGTLIYILVYALVSLLWRRQKYWRGLAWGIVGGSSLTLAMMLTLGLGTLLGFERLFRQFHLLFFSNEFWSAKGYMLMLFPEDFFYDAALFCAVATASVAVIWGGISGSYLMSSRNKQ